MQKREDTLREALVKNGEETALWTKYKEENATANENLDRFSKFLTIDVMVPIGRKAFMPGQLVHTNEVLVGHYQGYFSKCSAHKAKEICEYRVQMARDHLEKLHTESDLWQNKLEKPYAEGVFPSMDGIEIVEEYDEEKEKVWRERHKINVKLAKAKEKKNRDQEATKIAVEAKILEKAELIEEVKNELKIMDLEDVNNEKIKKLMSGEIKLPPEKQRVAHTPKISKSKCETEPMQEFDKTTHSIVPKLQGIIKKTDLELSIVPTNNNHHPNPDLTHSNIYHMDVDVEELPQEVQVIKEQAQFLPVSDQIDFYEFQIKIMRQKLLKLPLKTQDDIDQKVHILNVLETLAELLEIAEDTAEAQGEEEISTDREDEPQELSENVQETKENIVHKAEKRRISFALQNDTLEFRRNETVSEMLPKPQPQKRDFVILDEADSSGNAIVPPAKVVDHKPNINDKVEQNLMFIQETQSTKDFNLVDKILLESSLVGSYTLQLHFQHSTPNIATAKKLVIFESDSVPGSPADLYQAYLQNIENQDKNKSKSEQVVFANAYKGEEKVKVPILKEADRAQAYEDQRKEFCNPATETKSILRNKYAVEREQHNLDDKSRTAKNKNVTKKKKAANADKDEYMSAYYKVMNEVVEKPLTEPESLPECNYIDAHAPKKRVSRFKQSRGVAENAYV